MKSTLLYIILFLFTIASLFSQEDRNFQELRNKVNTTSGKEKIKWLDSLATQVYFSRDKEYDSLALETIKLSVTLDTLDVGAYHLVNYVNSIAVRRSRDSAIAILENFKEKYISKLKKQRRILNLYKAGALLYYNNQEFEKSLDYYGKALEAGLKTTDSQALGEIYMGKGMVQFEKGNVLESSQLLRKSIPFFRTSGSTNAIINVQNVMTSLYSQNGFYDQAAIERKEALELAQAENHHLFISQIKFNEGTELVKRGRLKAGVPLFEEAIHAVDSSRYKSYYKPIYLAQLASVHARLGNTKEARNWFNVLEQEPRKNRPGESKAYYLAAQMDIAFAEKEYKKALSIGKSYRNYKNEIGQTEGMERAELFLSKAHKALGNDTQALEHLKRYQSINDSITSLQKANGLAYYQTLYETEKRDATIAQQQGDIELLDAQNQIQRQWIVFGGLGLLLLGAIGYFWRARKAAQKEKVLQQQFSQDLLKAQEEERKTIAKELHDGIGQDLLLIKNSITINPDQSAGMVDKTIEDIRSISRNLHPVELEKFGLTKAIENLVARVSELTSIYFTEELDNVDASVSEEQSINLYRIIQECINNIIKHSEATASKVSLQDTNDRIVLTIQDNGKGFNPETGKQSKSLGLKSLMERVEYLKGRIDFDARPAQGTTITITLFKNAV